MDVETAALSYLMKTFRSDDDRYISSYSLEEVMSAINRAPLEVKDFLKRRCRTMKYLQDYLMSYDDYDFFWVENGRMALYDSILQEASDKAVSYFEDILDTYETRPRIQTFYGHIGQAAEEVIKFIRLFYAGDFKQFLLNHPDVFVVFTDNTVSLKENEAAKYFQERLREGREGWYYMNFRGCIGQAPKYIQEFINEYYPEEDFLEFLENNSYYFSIDEEDNVYLN